MSGRYEITDFAHGAIKVHDTSSATNQYVCIHPGSDPWSAFAHGAIRQLQQDLATVTAERDRLREQLSELDAECNLIANDCRAAEDARDELRSEHGPLVTRLFEAKAESDQLRTTLAFEQTNLQHISKINGELRARLDEIEKAPTITYLYKFPYMDGFVWRHSCMSYNGASAVESIELIQRPKVQK